MAKKISIKNPRISSSPESAEEWVTNREGTKRLTFDVPLSFHARLKIASVKLGVSMGNIIISGTMGYLDEQGIK